MPNHTIQYHTKQGSLQIVFFDAGGLSDLRIENRTSKSITFRQTTSIESYYVAPWQVMHYVCDLPEVGLIRYCIDIDNTIQKTNKKFNRIKNK